MKIGEGASLESEGQSAAHRESREFRFSTVESREGDNEKRGGSRSEGYVRKK